MFPILVLFISCVCSEHLCEWSQIFTLAMSLCTLTVNFHTTPTIILVQKRRKNHNCAAKTRSKKKKKKQLSLSRASSKSPFHIHIVIQAWSGFDLLRSSHCKCKCNRFFSSACDLVPAPEGPPVWIQQENLQNSVHSREQACSLAHTLKNTRHMEWWRAMFNCKCAKNISSNWRD